jgi:hypothetical protein
MEAPVRTQIGASCGVTQSHQDELNAVDASSTSPDSSRMAFARKILAALIATSLVVVPIGGTGFSNPIAPVEMLMVDQADMPCCPQSDTQDDFKAAACVLRSTCRRCPTSYDVRAALH